MAVFLKDPSARSLYKKAYLSNDAAAWMEVNLTSRPPTVWTHEAFKVAGIHTYIHLQKRRMCKNLSLSTFCKSTTTLFSKAVLFFLFFFVLLRPYSVNRSIRILASDFLKIRNRYFFLRLKTFFKSNWGNSTYKTSGRKNIP